MSLARALFSHRLTQFALLGGVVFLLAPRDAGRRITLEAEVLERAEARRLGVPRLSPTQAREVLARAVEDEILYREALRLGLDRSDPAVRQRLILKTLFLAEDLAGGAGPLEQPELRAHYAAHSDRWQEPAAVRFIHVFSSSGDRDRLGDLRAKAIELEARQPGRAPPLGDPFPRSRDVPRLPFEELALSYGSGLAEAVRGLRAGEWSEPVPSVFGWHVIKVLERSEPHVPPFEEVERRVRVDLQQKRKEDAIRAYLARVRPQYQVEVEGRVVPSTLAARSDEECE